MCTKAAVLAEKPRLRFSALQLEPHTTRLAGQGISELTLNLAFLLVRCPTAVHGPLLLYVCTTSRPHSIGAGSSLTGVTSPSAQGKSVQEATPDEPARRSCTPLYCDLATSKLFQHSVSAT